MAVRYTLPFSTDLGSRIVWELDILEEGFSGTPTSIVGTDSPISINYIQDRDVYKPILGSKATISMIATPDFQPARLYEGGEREFEVRLRYRDSGNNLVDYWYGWISPVEGSETITTFPFELEFIATDGIGLLEQASLDVPSSGTAVNLFNYITEALTITGLDLPIYINSGIQNASGDALLNTTIDPLAFFQDGIDSGLNHKEVLEGILTTFNCRVYQSAGRWYIDNCSSKGDSVTWKTFTPTRVGTVVTYNAGADVTESLRYNVAGTSSDLAVLNRDLHRFSRRPYGAVEARPAITDDSFRNFAPGNGSFENGTGWILYRPVFSITSAADNISTVGDHSVTTTRTNANTTANNNIWFRSPDIPVAQGFPFEVSYDIMYDVGDTSTHGVVLPVQLVIDTGSTFTYASSIFSNLGIGQTTGVGTNTARYLFYNFEQQVWLPVTNVNANRADGGTGDVVFNGTANHPDARDSFYERHVFEGNAGEWSSHSFTIGEALDSLYTVNRYVDVPLDNANLRVSFFYPQALDSNSNKRSASSSGTLRTYVDNVSLKYQQGSVPEPVFQRTQADYTSELSYEPLLLTEGSNLYVSRVEETGYWKEGQTVADTTSAERIVTQFKLNDYRSSFIYYQGDVVNLNAVPLSQHHKVRVNYSTFNETSSAIVRGGKFDVKKNTYDVEFYVPNQATDQASTFTTRDVLLIPEPFERSAAVDYVCEVSVIGLDGNDVPNQTNDSMGRAPGSTGYVTTNNSAVPDLFTTEGNTGFLRSRGVPGAILEGTLTIVPGLNRAVEAENLSIVTGGMINQPEFVEFGDFVNVGRDTVEVPYRITHPNRSEFEEISFQGQVLPFVGENNTVDLTLALSAESGQAAGVTISSTMRRTIAPPGSSIPVQVFITPAAGMQLSSTGLNAPTFTLTGTDTATTIVSSTGFSQLGMNLVWEGVVTIPTTAADTDVTATFSIPAGNQTALPAGADASTVSIDFVENITNVSVGIADLTGSNALVGLVGTTQTINVPCYAASGFMVDFDNFSIATSNASLAIQLPDPTTENIPATPVILVPVEVKFPSGGGSVTLTVSGSAQAIGAETVDTTVTLTNNIANTTLVEATETLTLSVGTEQVWTTVLRGNAGYNLQASNVTAAGWTITDIGADAVELRRTITAGTDVSTTLTLAGTITREPHTLLVNVVNNVIGSTINTTQFEFGFGDGETVLANVEPTAANRTLTLTAATGLDAFTMTGNISVTYNGTALAASNISFSSGTISIVLVGAVPTPNDAGVSMVDVVISGNPLVVGETQATTIAENVMAGVDATTVSISAPNGIIPSQGGLVELLVEANGNWTAAASITENNSRYSGSLNASGVGVGVTSGSFGQPVLPAPMWDAAPLSGGSGNSVIVFKMNELAFVSQSGTGSIGTIAGAYGVFTATFTVTGATGVTDTATVQQRRDRGTRDITLAAGITDTQAAQISTAIPNWTFYN